MDSLVAFCSMEWVSLRLTILNAMLKRGTPWRVAASLPA
jgi:hypothetical protein